MNKKKSYILTGGRVVDPFRGIDAVMDIGVMDGVIVEPESVVNPETIDVSGLIVAPGFIDMHVHLRQPGNHAAETIATGTMAAAAGGFSGIVPMPNTSPAADTPGAIEYIKRHTEREGKVKVYPCGCMTKNLEGKEMAGIGSLKAAGVVAVSDDGKCIQNHELMRHVAEYTASFGLPILDHCEDDCLKGEGVMHEGVWSVLLGMQGISSASEELMIARDIIMSRMSGCRIHIQHLSCQEGVSMIRHAREKGILISAEVTPHHISLTDECIKKFDTNYKMNPPLRSEYDRQALIQGLADGTITVIATDHAPHTATAKLVEFDYAPFGIVGLETAIPVCLSELYHTGVLSISSFVSKFTVGPAEILGFKNKSLAAGNPADITIIDLNREFTVDASKFYSKSRNTPYNGMTFKGKAVATVVDGKFVFSEL
ncbi:MAG: dihydroorotase [Victivallaceae bacterium]